MNKIKTICNTKKRLSSILYFVILITFLNLAISPFKASAYGSTFDGGKLQGIEEMCTCSGGITINIQSYVDNTKHVYLYQMGATQLDAKYNIMSSDAYFLTTLSSFAMCLVYEGEDCESSDTTPEGMFLEVGTSFNDKKESLFTEIKLLPGISDVTKMIPDIFVQKLLNI
ncbi:MAG: hypothetical protein Q7R78_02265 [bacterium]|nr:hypothetical protein [bacterium]